NTPIVNTLYNIKYFIDRNQNAKLPNAGYDLDFKNDNIAIYKNKYYLGIGFMVKDTIRDWDENIRNPFLSQEQFVTKALDRDEKLFETIPPTGEVYENITKIEPSTGRIINYSNEGSSKD